jgi:hypothetical protein
VSIEQDPASFVAQGAAEAIDQRALAGAVWADQAQPLAASDYQIDALERNEAAEALADAADF